MVRSATLTTVPSSRVIPEPRTAAAIDRPAGRRTHPDRLPDSESGTCPTVLLRGCDQAPRHDGAPARRARRPARRGAPADRPRRPSTTRCATRACSTQRYGHVLDYMARVELEVDRNVLELIDDAARPARGRPAFYADVWQPQEIRHGQILDELQVRLGRDRPTPDLDHVSAQDQDPRRARRTSTAIQDVCRMLYYLTGMATERSAVLAYNLLHDGRRRARRDRRRRARSSAQIRRQEPGHYAFYQMSARGPGGAARRPGRSGWSGTCAASPSRRSAPTTTSRRPTSAT